MAALIRKSTYYCRFHAYSIWLFTFTDLSTILIPSSTFGILNGVAISLDKRSASSTSHVPTSSQILSRTPVVVLWVWINLLPFAIGNQRQPDSIHEDALNKPWRPLPSRRLPPESARRLMLFFYFIAVIFSYLVGSLPQCLLLVLLGYGYNDLNGADVSCVLRQWINACGYTCFTSGAVQVAMGGYGSQSHEPESLLRPLAWWYGVLACVIFTTVQTQDMYDQRGDAARDRKTLPLVFGDGPSRWMIAIPTILWSWVTPLLWNTSPLGYIIIGALGTTITTRTLILRTEVEDKRTFQFWNVWLACIYSLPLFKACEQILKQ